ncbi:MAG: UxaA family hydrolase [Pseudomonadota bacterium]
MIHTAPIEGSQAGLSGFARHSGAVGVRNNLVILNLTGLSEMAARRASAAVPRSVLVSFPYGMGLVGEDLAAATRLLSGIAMHPNAGAVVLVSADRTRLEEISAKLEREGRAFEGICIDDVAHDSGALSARIVRAGARLAQAASTLHRTPFSLGDLCFAVECGLSDPTSGIAANRLIGEFSDRVISAGGTVIMGETLEWLGVEKVLADRAASPEVASAILTAVARREAMAQRAGVDLLGVNPNRRNIEEGLTTIEEKASGAIAKSGNAEIQGMLAHGEAPAGPGLWLMDQPSYSPESLTGFASAGAQIALFSTGSGNSYASALMPTIKITANAQTAKRLDTQVDFDCSELMAGGDIDKVTDRLLTHVAAVASGMLTFGEIMGEGSEAFSRFGATL